MCIKSQQRFKVKSKIQILVIGERGRSKLERVKIKRGMGYQDQVTENGNITSVKLILNKIFERKSDFAALKDKKFQNLN